MDRCGGRRADGARDRVVVGAARVGAAGLCFATEVALVLAGWDHNGPIGSDVSEVVGDANVRHLGSLFRLWGGVDAPGGVPDRPTRPPLLRRPKDVSAPRRSGRAGVSPAA